MLAEYRRNGSDAAFRELVARFVDLVYSTALRLVEGDTHRAEDVTQTIFVDLARLARTLSPEVRLGGWLHRHTCFVAANTLRGERRRQARERQAVEMNALQNHSEADFSQVAPLLDEAINELGEADRTAILLRFFEQQDFRAVGQALGSNEDAARMRVTRALEKLEGFLKRRGVTTSAASLGVVLTANAVQAAPVGLAVTISTAAALPGTTIAATATATATKAIAMTTLQKTLITVTLAAVAATTLVMQHQSLGKMRIENESLRQQIAQQDQRSAANERSSNLVAQPNSSQTLPPDQFGELLRLRGEVGVLRNRTNELEKLITSLANTRRTPAQPPEVPPEDIFPRAAWKFSGNATPEAAFQSMIWALSRGDAKVILESYIPEVRNAQEKEWAEQPEAQLKDQLVNATIEVTGFRILRRDAISDDEVFLTVFTEGKRASEGKFRVTKIEGEWKIDPRKFDPATRSYR